MRALVVVVMQPFIQIGLQRVDAVIELLAERDLVELLQDRLVEPLADAVGLGRLHLSLCVIDVVDRQEELEVVFVNAATIFGAAIRHDPQHRQVVFFVEWQHPVVEQVGRGDRRLGGVEFGMGHLAIGVHVGLLVDPANALEGADIERVLAAQITRMSGLNLAAGLIVQLLLFKRLNLGLGQDCAFLGNLGFQRLEPLFEVGQIVPQPDRPDS